MKKQLKKALGLTLASVLTVSAGMQLDTGLTTYAGIFATPTPYVRTSPTPSTTPAVSPSTEAYTGTPSVSDVKQTDLSTSTITVSWKGDTRAKSYEVAYKEDKNAGAEFTVAGQTSTTSYTLEGLKSGCAYSIRVTPIRGDGKTGSESTCWGAKTKIEKICGLKQDEWYHLAKCAMVSWERGDVEDGFEYMLKGPSGKVIKQEKIEKTGFLKFDVENNNIYQFSLRAYQNINGTTVYTPWDTIQVFEQPWAKSVSVKKVGKRKKQLRISWYKQAGATGYEVYVSKTNKASKYRKVASVGKNKTSISLSKFNKKKINGTYYVYIVSVSKNDKGTSRSGTTYVWQTGQSVESYLH